MTRDAAIAEVQRRITMAALGADEAVARPALGWLYRHMLDIYMETADRAGVVSILEPRYDLTHDLQLAYAPAGCVIVQNTREQALLGASKGALRLFAETAKHPALALFVLDTIEAATEGLSGEAP